MKVALLQRLALPKTALWIGATRLGPIASGCVAAATLPTFAYSQYVVALAWLGGVISVLASAVQALAVRAGETRPDANTPGSGFNARYSLGITLVVPPILAAVSFALSYDIYTAVALSLAGLMGSVNAVFSTLLWSQGKTSKLTMMSLLESGLMVLGVAFASISFETATAVLFFMLAASVLACLGYGWALKGSGKLSDLWCVKSPSVLTTLKSNGLNTSGIMTPTLINGAVGAAGPAIALGIAAGRDPASAAIYGFIMLLVAAGLFPLQILAVAAARPLVASANRDRIRIAAVTLLIASVWGLSAALGLALFGPSIGTAIGSTLAQSTACLIGAALLICLSPIVMAGPIVQTERFYWLWAAVNSMSCLAFVAAAYALPNRPELALQACLISAASRLLLALPLTWFIMIRWHRQT